MVQSIEECFQALGEGSVGFEKLIGTPEASWIEFKSRPYRFDEHRQKIEFAKDVSAFANADGGLLLIGIQTEKEETSEQDVAQMVTPVTKPSFRQMKDLLRAHVYPPLNAEVRWWPADDPECGLVTVQPTRVDEAEKPFLTTTGIDAEGNLVGSAVGLWVRAADSAQATPASILQELIRAGRRARDRGFELAESAGPIEGVGSADSHQGLRQIGGITTPAAQLAADLVQFGEEETALLFLQARPTEGTSVPLLLSGDLDAATQMMLHPPQLRPNGFNLDFGTEVERLAHGGLRTLRPGAATLSVAGSGLTTAVFGYYFLGWAMERYSTQGLINPLVLVEFVTEFARFYVELVLGQSPVASDFVVGIRNSGASGGLKLIPGGLLDDRGFGARGGSVGIAEDRDEFELPLQGAASDPFEVAHDLLVAVYREFGLSAVNIPYSVGGRIDEAALTRA